jgi:hypothetical protein
MELRLDSWPVPKWPPTSLFKAFSILDLSPSSMRTLKSLRSNIKCSFRYVALKDVNSADREHKLYVLTLQVDLYGWPRRRRVCRPSRRSCIAADHRYTDFLKVHMSSVVFTQACPDLLRLWQLRQARVTRSLLFAAGTLGGCLSGRASRGMVTSDRVSRLANTASTRL